MAYLRHGTDGCNIRLTGHKKIKRGKSWPKRHKNRFWVVLKGEGCGYHTQYRSRVYLVASRY